MSEDWLTNDGQVVHPNAPRGGGAGGFRSARHFGADGDSHGIPHPNSPAGRNAVLSRKEEAVLKAAYGVPANRVRKQVQELMIYDADDFLVSAAAKLTAKSYDGGGWTHAFEGVSGFHDLVLALTGYRNLKQVTFNTHGAPGTVTLSTKNGVRLQETNLDTLPISEDLYSGEGRLLFMGCNVAEFKQGEDFLLAAGRRFFRNKGGVVGGSTIINEILPGIATTVGTIGRSSETWFTVPVLGKIHKWKFGEFLAYRLDEDGKIVATQRIRQSFF